MSSNTLDGLGRTVLERLSAGGETVEGLAATVDASPAELGGRLAHLVDNALARRTGDGRFVPTENGHRLLEATPAGRHDERIDTPPHVRRHIEDWELRPDEAAALRKAFAFLRYWGEATTAEIVDATYSEEPAGYRHPDRWWTDCIEHRLATLPDVRHVPQDAVGDRWLYEGRATIETPADGDGREVGRPATRPSLVGSARHAIERDVTTPGERAAARCAFALVHRGGRVTPTELVERCYEFHPAGFAAPGAWLNRLAALLAGIPAVECRTSEAGQVWVYSPAWVGRTR